MRVTIVNSARGFDAAPGQSLLDAALGAAWNLPHGCQGGNCGLCKARLVRGAISYPNGRPLGLTEAEIAARSVLLCQAQASSDIQLELHEMRPADEAGTLRLPCRIERAILVAHDVMRVLLRRPPALEFGFKPGQYVDVLLPDGRRRSYSIASPPHASQLLELHVRRVAGGSFSEWLFAGAANLAEALITLEGPLGGFYYRPAPLHAGPLLLVGGGTGVAPLLSILRHVIDNKIDRELTLYWGVLGSRDLYAEDAIRQLQSAAPHLRYVPVLSEAEMPWQGRRGYVHEAVLEDHDVLGGYDIYSAGPPAMIEALRPAFVAHGAAAHRLYCDSFDYARDASDRQRTSAATKS